MGTPVETLTPIQFIEILNPTYPHICAFQFIGTCKDPKDIQLFLDHFQGNVTHSWQSLRKNKNIFVFPKGDECNFGISIADVILKVLDYRLLRSRGRLFPADIEKALPEAKSLKTHFIGQKFLKYIVPITDRPIEIRDKLKRPIIFFIKERTPLVSKRAIEESPLVDAALDRAATLHGSFKYFDSERDPAYIRKTDYVTCMGADGERAVRSLRILGYEFNVITPEELLSEKQQ